MDATELSLRMKLSHRVRRFDQVDLQIRQQLTDGQWLDLQVQVGDPSRFAETISKEWTVKASAPEGTDAGLLTKKVQVSLRAIA